MADEFYTGTKTIKRNRRRARLVITYEIEFSEAALADAPPHLRNALSLLREILAEANTLEAELLEDAGKMFGDDDIKFIHAKVEVAS